MLTREAWNAFLKTLEEPPPNTVFILATTEPHKVMPTIVDRCQRFDFQRPSLEQIAEVVGRVGEPRGSRSRRAPWRDRPRRRGQLPRRARHPRPARLLRRQGGRDRRRARRPRGRRRRADPRRPPTRSPPATAGRRSRSASAWPLRPRRHAVRPRPARPPAPADRGANGGRGPRHVHASPGRTRSGCGPRRSRSPSWRWRSVDMIAKALADIREGDEPRMTRARLASRVLGRSWMLLGRLWRSGSRARVVALAGGAGVAGSDPAPARSSSGWRGQWAVASHILPGNPGPRPCARGRRRGCPSA